MKNIHSGKHAQSLFLFPPCFYSSAWNRHNTKSGYKLKKQETIKQDRMSTTVKEMQKHGERDAVPLHLNRWQYGCIKQIAGEPALLLLQSPLNP